tara:strand:+ start:8396 stop:9490 length:1095 start_codon:yes stop_codon:yes gene_type:complete
MHQSSSTIAALALLASACGSSGDAGQADGAPALVDAASETIDAARIDAARIDAAPIADAAPRPDAIPGFTCGAPVPLAPGDSFLGDTSDYNNTSSASCSAGTQSARDTVFRVVLPSTPTDLIARVTVDSDATPTFDAVVSIQTSCGDADTEVACSDFGFSEQAVALGLSDEAFISVDGTEQFGGSPDGAYQLDVSTRAIVAELATCDALGLTSRCETGFLCSEEQCQAESPALACSLATPLTPGIEVGAQTHAYQTDFFQGSCAFKASAGAGEAFFSFSLTETSSIDVTTDLPGTNFDTVLYLKSACEGAELACADDIDPDNSNFLSRLQVSDLPAGDYLIVVDGASNAAPSGSVRLRLDVASD